MLNRNFVNVIGCGYAGIEAALFLAGHGIKVHVFGNEKLYRNGKVSSFSKGVYQDCLRKELSLFGSPLARKEEQLEKEGHEKCLEQLILTYGINLLKNNRNIEFFDASVCEINPSEINIIATGPRTEEKFFKSLTNRYGSMRCLNHIPKFPIIANINSYMLYENRDGSLVMPITREGYETLEKMIAQIAQEKKLVDKNFEIVPNTIEALALHGKETLRAYAMIPQRMGVGIKPYACLYLIKKGDGYQVQNFASCLSDEEQLKIFQSIDVFRDCQIIESSEMVAGTFISTLQMVNEYSQSKQDDNIFFAGGILGVTGHLNCIASGLWTALNVYKYIQGKRMVGMPEECAIGKLIKKLTKENALKTRPLIRNGDIMEKMDDACWERKSLLALEKFKEDYKNAKYV